MAFIREADKVNGFNEEELRKHGYTLRATLGKGSYAIVKAAYSDRKNCKIALKIINKRKAPKEFLDKFLPRELEILKTVIHPHVTQLYEILESNNKVFICMELAGHGDLADYIKLRGAITEDRSRIMFHQLISAIQYLHSINIVHRDLKCENILLDISNNIKVSDFGFARVLLPGQLSETFCGSVAYAAPEILQGIPYVGPAYDVWSCGVILYLMVCGTMPYDDTNIKKMIKYQTEKKVTFNRVKIISKQCKELIWIILDHNPITRATVNVILDSPWITCITKPPPEPEIVTEPSPFESKASPPIFDLTDHTPSSADLDIDEMIDDVETSHTPDIPTREVATYNEPRPKSTPVTISRSGISPPETLIRVRKRPEPRPKNPVPPPVAWGVESRDSSNASSPEDNVTSPEIPLPAHRQSMRSHLLWVSNFKRRFRGRRAPRHHLSNSDQHPDMFVTGTDDQQNRESDVFHRVLGEKVSNEQQR